MKNTKIIFNSLLPCLLLGTINSAYSEPRSLSMRQSDFLQKDWEPANPSSTSAKNITYTVPLNKSGLVHLSGNVKKISKGNPKIANILLFPPNQLFIQGRALGTTNAMIWGTHNKMSQIINIEVTHDLESLKAKLFELLPNEEIFVRSSQKSIVLSGEISSLANMQAAIDIAQSYLGGSLSKNKQSGGSGDGSTSINVGNAKNREKSKGDVPQVINLMSVGGGQQVMLNVTIAEIDRKLFRGLDVKYNSLHASNNFNFGALNSGGSLLPALIPGSTPSVDAIGLFLSGISGNYAFNLTIDAAENESLAKILAEPVLTTLSGQEATFISGGEFPVPVPQSGGAGGGTTITIEFKQFGITMRMLPVVLDSGRINLNLNVGVSELSEDAAIIADVPGSNTSFSIPSLTLREASSTIELGDGQTMSIAGLISEKVRSNVDKFPWLGDIPVLGILFRSESFLKARTELVIFVTPHLAKPILAENIKLPTDYYVEPDDMDFYILGRLESRDAKLIIEEERLNLNDPKGGLEGQFGHQLIEEDNSL